MTRLPGPLVCMITSCKGGVGKSTICANLGRALAQNGRRTVMVDCDFGMRTLDLICGVADSVVYDCFDVIWRGVLAETAAVTVPEAEDRSTAEPENLLLLASPFSTETFKSDAEQSSEQDSGQDSGQDSAPTSEKAENSAEKPRTLIPTPGDMEALRDNIIRRLDPSVILLDMPGSAPLDPDDMDSPTAAAAKISDAAIICTTDQPSSIRAASKTASILRDFGLEETRLVINQFGAVEKLRSREQAVEKIASLIDQTSVRLCGVIPFDPDFQRAADTGELIDSKIFRRGVAGRPSNSAKAIHNIALRLYGPSGVPFSGAVPLFSSFTGKFR